MEVHANVVHMLGTRRLIRPSGWLTSFAIQGLVTFVAGVILTLLQPLPGSLLAMALTLVVGLPASYAAFHGGGYAVDFLLPVVAVCILGVVAQAQARRRVRESFDLVETRFRGEMPVKGRTAPLRVYEVVPPQSNGQKRTEG